MKKFLVFLVVAAAVGGAVWWFWLRDGAGAAGKGGVVYRLAPIVKMDITRTVEATGSVTPRNSSSGIPVGAQVNGKIIKLFVDYNSTVTNGQVVALIDPLVYEANYKSAVAQLHVNEANVEVRKAALRSAEAALRSAEAEMVNAQKIYDRKKNLVDRNNAPVADLDNATEALERAKASVDSAKASVDSAKASLASAKASVEQSKATAEKAKTDLGYCTIVSPVDGVVIDRKVEEGQTVVSSMNAVPVLTIAEDLKVVWVEATVPEADVGDVKVGQKVTFTADAYNNRRFTGVVRQVRKAAVTTNNVVTFPVIIEADNPGEMLFPGMTATLSIETASRTGVVAVAAAAFRFRPKEEDRARAGDVPRGRKIWLKPRNEGDPMEYVLAKEGVSDSSFTEILAEDAAALEGREAVVGYQAAASAAKQGDVANPFAPKFPARNKNKGTAPEPKAGK